MMITNTQDIKQQYKHALNLPSTPPEPLGPACCEMGGWQGSIKHILDEGYELSKQPQVHHMRQNLRPLSMAALSIDGAEGDAGGIARLHMTSNDYLSRCLQWKASKRRLRG